MREEIQTISDFVEGTIDGPELGRRLSATPSEFETALGDDPNLPTEDYLDGSVYQFLLKQDFNHIADVFNTHRILSDYLFRNAIPSDPSGAYRTYLNVLVQAQPEWLSVTDTDYFRNDVLPEAGDRAGEDLRLWIHVQLLERFPFVKEPPDWLQGEGWPIRENGPLLFLGEIEVEDYFHDDAKAYVFYDPERCVCETVLQVG